jgi:hypothetical protein
MRCGKRVLIASGNHRRAKNRAANLQIFSGRRCAKRRKGRAVFVTPSQSEGSCQPKSPRICSIPQQLRGDGPVVRYGTFAHQAFDRLLESAHSRSTSFVWVRLGQLLGAVTWGQYPRRKALSPQLLYGTKQNHRQLESFPRTVSRARTGLRAFLPTRSESRTSAGITSAPLCRCRCA